MMRQAWRDGLRSLRLDARVAVTAVSLVGVAIGATTAVFAVVQGIVLRPFAFVDQDRVARRAGRTDPIDALEGE